MQFFRQFLLRPALPFFAATTLIASGALVGCSKKVVKVYTVEKEKPFDAKLQGPQSAAPKPNPHGGNDADDAPRWRPAVAYKAPEKWENLGLDAANLARFKIGNVYIAITALPLLAGDDAGLINMYRQVRDLPPLDEVSALAELKPTSVGREIGKLYEISDKRDGVDRHLAVAFVHLAEGSLFIKMEGLQPEVLANKADFLEFLKTVEITAGTTPLPAPKQAPSGDPHGAAQTPPTPPASPAPAPTPPTPSPAAAVPTSTAGLPAGWKPLQPGQMQNAKFQVPDVEGTSATASLSIFGQQAGDLAPNVNRWRGLIGLAPLDDAAAAASVKPLEGAPAGSHLLQLENGAKALTMAIVPRNGEWWYFKLEGGTPAVKAALEGFIALAKFQP